MKRMNMIWAAVMLALAIGGAWWFANLDPAAGANTADNAAADNADEPGGVLVQTIKPSQQAMPLTMSVFGDVVPGKVESQSFPQAGQVTKLAVVSGQAVHKGDLLATMASDPNALVSYEQASSALDFARSELKRQKDLLALQLSTQSQVDSAAKAVADAQAALDAQIRLNGAHGSVDLRAQFNGVVSAIPVAQGDRVAAGATIVQLGRTDTLRAMLAIEPARAAELSAGMKVSIEPPQDGKPKVATTLASVQTMVDPKTQNAGAIALLPAAAQATLPVGTHLQAVIELGSRSAWAVPRQAVLVDDDGAYLFQVAKNKAHRVAVRKLVETDKVTAVEGPIDAALPVVVLGNYELKDGGSVRRSAP